MANYLDREYEWTKKTVCRAIFAIKFVLSIIIGLTLGIVGIQGWMGYAVFFAMIVIVSAFFVYYYSLDELDPEVKFADAFNEGLGSGLSSFLLCWIISFTIFHAPL